MKSERQARTWSGGAVYRNERGMVTATGLLISAVLTLLGTTAVMITATDLKIGGNYKVSEQAFYAAEAGLEEARGRLAGAPTAATYVGDPAAAPDLTWSAYLLTASSWQTSADPQYSTSYENYIPTTASKTATAIVPNSLQTSIPYWVKIKHKREYDAEQGGHTTVSPHYYDGDGSTATHTASAPGNLIYYGYGNPNAPAAAVQFTTASATQYQPVEVVSAYGSSGGSSQIVNLEVGRDPGPPTIAALYSRGNVSVGSASASIDGRDNCGTGVALAPIYTLSPATTSANQNANFNGKPATPQQGTASVDVAKLITSFKPGAIIINSDQSGTNFGSSTNYVGVYSNTSNPLNPGGLELKDGTGYGILMVEGDLELKGGFSWNGIVLVTGLLSFNGGGGKINIKGAVLSGSNQTVDISGGLDIRFDSCQVTNSLQSRPLRTLSWKQIY